MAISAIPVPQDNQRTLPSTHARYIPGKQLTVLLLATK